MATDFAKHLRNTMTDAERLIWLHLRNRQIANAKFRRQHPLGNYVVDFVCLEMGLVVEIDGGQHVDQESHDAARTAWLESEGFRVVRFWNHEVLKETEAVLQRIYDILQQQ